MSLPRIAVDAMGGDEGVRTMVAGAALARQRHDRPRGGGDHQAGYRLDPDIGLDTLYRSFQHRGHSRWASEAGDDLHLVSDQMS